jgi:NAD(P)H dehydrogenase (quinone)
MKKVLIVHAHPEPQSFSAAMKMAAADEFRAQGHEVRVSDLYEKGFNPVASPADFLARANPDYLTYALEQRNGFSGNTLAADIAEEVANVLWADLLVLNFPIYWFSVPAIMKGWIDRVFLSGPFYGGLRFYDKGGLRGKAAWVTATLGGQPHMFAEDGVHGPLEEMLRPLLRGTLGYVGFDVLEPFIGYHIPYITQEQREAVMTAFRNDVRCVSSRERLRFPSLDNFDAGLHPLADHAKERAA